MKTSTGNRSTGNRSTGNYSTGNWSTGNWSTGNSSTGDRSTGNWSTGDWSISNYSTGHFSTEDYSGYGCFDKPCTVEEWNNAEKPSWLYFGVTEWREESDMTDKEKEENPNYKTTEGYLKKLDYKESFQNSYNKATRGEQLAIKKLPNFNADKFFKISGIRIEEESLSGQEVSVTIGDKVYKAIIT